VLSFGSQETRLEVALTNTGVGTLEVAPPVVITTDGHDWLAARLTPERGTPLIVEVDRAGLPARRYAGRVLLEAAGVTRVVEVSMEVVATARVPDIGTVHVRLLDPATGQVAAAVESRPEDGYAYAFGPIPAGAYQLLAGTDRDGDGTLCEADDFCGAYPVLNEPVTLEVAGEAVGGLDFALTYQGAGAGLAAQPGL
jgi:serine protease